MDRRIYEMSEEQYQELINSIFAGDEPHRVGDLHMSPSRQAKAEAAWKKLGEKMGFYGDTARGYGNNGRRFTAVPREVTGGVGTAGTSDINPQAAWPFPSEGTSYDPTTPTPEPERFSSGSGGDYSGGGASSSYSSSDSSSDSGSSSSSTD